MSYDSYEDALNIVTAKLDEWKEDIEKAWMSFPSSKNKYDAENRVKFSLDCLAYLLLQASHNATRDSGVTSLYKEKEKRRRELPYDFQADFHKEYTSEPDEPENRLTTPAVDVTPKKQRPRRQQTKSDRRKRFLKQYGLNEWELTFTFCVVDTENLFWYDGRQYLIDEQVTQYQPKEVKGDILYDMDQIVVCKTGSGDQHYLDSDFNVINSDYIHTIG